MVCAYCSAQRGGGVNPDLSANPSNTSENSSISLNTEHIEVASLDADAIEESDGIHINAAQLAKLNMAASNMESLNNGKASEVKCLMLPGYVVFTNLPCKLKTLDAIEELLYRQDELKKDFSLPIMQLVQMM